MQNAGDMTTNQDLEKSMFQDNNIRDMLSSLVVAESMVDTVISKVMHIKYMQELEAKVHPFVINYTFIQNLKAIDGIEFKYDTKIDDHLISAQQQEIDEEEPRSFADCMAPSKEIKYKNPMPVINVDESNSPDMAIVKGLKVAKKTSSHNVSVKGANRT